jgi:hypothetical protein
MGLTNVWVRTLSDGLIRADHIVGIDVHRTRWLEGTLTGCSTLSCQLRWVAAGRRLGLDRAAPDPAADLREARGRSGVAGRPACGARRDGRRRGDRLHHGSGSRRPVEKPASVLVLAVPGKDRPERAVEVTVLITYRSYFLSCPMSQSA